MDLVLKEPFSISFEGVEVDDYLPAVNFDIQLAYTGFSDHYEYKGNFWIDCSSFSTFQENLGKPILDNIQLTSIENDFLMSITPIQEHNFIFCLQIEKTNLDKKKIKILMSAEVDRDVVSVIQREFKNFPSWW